LAFLPSVEAYCRATATERLPFFGRRSAVDDQPRIVSADLPVGRGQRRRL